MSNIADAEKCKEIPIKLPYHRESYNQPSPIRVSLCWPLFCNQSNHNLHGFERIGKMPPSIMHMISTWLVKSWLIILMAFLYPQSWTSKVFLYVKHIYNWVSLRMSIFFLHPNEQVHVQGFDLIILCHINSIRKFTRYTVKSKIITGNHILYFNPQLETGRLRSGWWLAIQVK